MPLPSNIPQQGAKPQNVSQTVKGWAEQLAARATSEAEKRLKVGQFDPAAAQGGTGDLGGSDLVLNTSGQRRRDRASMADLAAQRRSYASADDFFADLAECDRAIDRHAFSSATGTEDESTLDFFADDLEAQRAKERRDRQRTQQRNDPTAGASVEKHAAQHPLADYLHRGFGHEFTGLSPQEQQAVGDDFQSACDEDGCGISEYARRIGKGNLASYARSLKASNAKGGPLPGGYPPQNSARQTRYSAAPPGFDHVVRRLGGGPDAHSLAWAMSEAEASREHRHAQSLESIDFVPGCYSRNLRILDSIADGRYRAAREVINRAADDALADISRSFARGDTIGDAWRHVLEAARTDALSSVQKHSIMRWSWKPEVTMGDLQRHEYKPVSGSKEERAADKARREEAERRKADYGPDNPEGLGKSRNRGFFVPQKPPNDKHSEITDHEPGDGLLVDGQKGAKRMDPDSDDLAGLDPDKHFFERLAELDRHADYAKQPLPGSTAPNGRPITPSYTWRGSYGQRDKAGAMKSDAGELRELGSEDLADTGFRRDQPAKAIAKLIEEQTAGPHRVDKRRALADMKADAALRRAEGDG